MPKRLDAFADVVMAHPHPFVRNALAAGMQFGLNHPAEAARKYLSAVVLWSIAARVKVTPALALQIAGRVAERCADVVDLAEASGASRGPYDEEVRHG
ncbi:hypothetical protein QUC32_23200 [Novosphingobium resinovorum]|uniref:hypothetical protein n=1 Tax=Novosphingobium TaxID=165696 RepID=UPI001B3C871B|nr:MULTISPECIES: hypothetical protein [Novosphingobium]MBF7012559.1 hypothetical protein [Novosphingobium sp. HR1a]WJM27292.1 hypothetical protein QUC32_23200 [Novosphingobium resinovorum]